MGSETTLAGRPTATYGIWLWNAAQTQVYRVHVFRSLLYATLYTSTEKQAV